MKEKKIAAFFDIDGTLYRDSLMFANYQPILILSLIKLKIWE